MRSPFREPYAQVLAGVTREPHGFRKREHVVDGYTRVADLFAKYLRWLSDDGSSRPHEPPE